MVALVSVVLKTIHTLEALEELSRSEESGFLSSEVFGAFKISDWDCSGSPEHHRLSGLCQNM